MTTSPAALQAVRVLDLTDERGIYGAKLLADLGADVLRCEPRQGDPLRQRGPTLDAGGDAQSLWYAFFASSRRIATLDLDTQEGIERLRALVDDADIVLSCAGAFAVAEAQLEAARAKRPELVVVETSSFGACGPWRDYLAPDLVAGALGGAVATSGDVDTPPLKTFGELNLVLSGAYSAIAALAALHRVRRSGSGQRGEVSVHESIASCLEHVLMWYWYHERMPNAAGPVLARRGSLHWSNAYVVVPAKGGGIMVTPTPNLDNQLVWLIEKEVQQDLLDPKYQQPENRGAFIRRLMEVLRQWAAGQDVEELFFEAQERHAPYGWVLPLPKVAENPQLQARRWWQKYRVGGGAGAAAEVRGPGAPYRFGLTPWRLRDSVHASGFRPRQAVRQHGSEPAAADERPLGGLRVLDFTHVLAGPFATRILADLGADVVKVNSSARAGPNALDGVYYVMWNRNKRALALDMSQQAGRDICLRLCETADVVIDNFSVGVLERWGVGYERVSPANPKVIYVQMSGMGEGGPWSNFVTYAPTIHALSGLTRLTGVEGREDIGIGFSYNDHCAGLHGACAILAALEARRQVGRGQRIDLSQFEVGVNLVGPSLLDYFANGKAAEPCGNRLPYDCAAPHGCYPCAADSDAATDSAAAADSAVVDERWLAIACMTDQQWQALRGVMGDPSWAQAPRLATAKGRAEATDLDDRIGQWTKTLRAEDLMQRCQAAGVPAGVVQTGKDLGERDAQLRHAGFLRVIGEPHPVLGDTYADRLPIRFDATPCEEYRRTRRVGEDNAAVLAEWLGMSAAEVRQGEDEGYLA